MQLHLFINHSSIFLTCAYKSLSTFERKLAYKYSFPKIYLTRYQSRDWIYHFPDIVMTFNHRIYSSIDTSWSYLFWADVCMAIITHRAKHVCLWHWSVLVSFNSWTNSKITMNVKRMKNSQANVKSVVNKAKKRVIFTLPILFATKSKIKWTKPFVHQNARK